MLTSVTSIREHLNWPSGDTSLDNLFQAMMYRATTAIRRYLGYNIERKVYSNVEFHSGDSTKILRLNHSPVYSVEAVYVDDTAYMGQGTNPWPASDLLTAGADYMLKYDDTDLADTKISRIAHIVRVSNFSSWSTYSGTQIGLWPIGEGNIRVDYTAGYTAELMPPEIEHAANMLVSNWVSGQEDVSSIKLGDASVSFATSKNDREQKTSSEAFPDDVAALLDPYVRRRCQPKFTYVNRGQLTSEYVDK